MARLETYPESAIEATAHMLSMCNTNGMLCTFGVIYEASSVDSHKMRCENQATTISPAAMYANNLLHSSPASNSITNPIEVINDGWTRVSQFVGLDAE